MKTNNRAKARIVVVTNSNDLIIAHYRCIIYLPHWMYVYKTSPSGSPITSFPASKRRWLQRYDVTCIPIIPSMTQCKHITRPMCFFFALVSSRTVETTAFLGACVGFVVLLVVVALYLSRKWYSTPPATTTTLFGGVCVPLCEASDVAAAQNLGISSFLCRFFLLFFLFTRKCVILMDVWVQYTSWSLFDITILDIHLFRLGVLNSAMESLSIENEPMNIECYSLISRGTAHYLCFEWHDECFKYIIYNFRGSDFSGKWHAKMNSKWEWNTKL